jgi:hypothetical protein
VLEGREADTAGSAEEGDGLLLSGCHCMYVVITNLWQVCD